MIVVCDPHRHCRRHRLCSAVAVFIVIIAAVAVTVTVAVVILPLPLPLEFPPPQPLLLLLVDCGVCLCPPLLRRRRRRHPLCRQRRHRHRHRRCRRRLMECSPCGGRRRAMTVSSRQRETEGGGLRERWTKAADGGCNGNQGPKRMDMRLMRCWASAQHDIRYLILLCLRHEDLGRQVKNQ